MKVFGNLIAVDDGYAQVKVYRPALGQIEQVRGIFPTALRAGKAAVTGLDGRTLGETYEADGETFVAETGFSEETRWDGFHVSAMNRVSIHHGLAKAGLGGTSLQLVAGLPVREYFRNGTRNSDFIDSKIESLKKPVRHIESQGIMIDGVLIAPQAISVFSDWALDDNYRLRDPDLKNAEIGVVDIGDRTTDIAVITKGGAGVDHARSGTETIGMLDVLAGIENGLRVKYDLPDEKLPHKILMDALLNGSTKLFGKPHAAQDVVVAAIQEIQARIARVLRQRLSSGLSLHSILFVGGGILAMPGLAKAFTHNAIVPADPEFANARGMYRLGVAYLTKLERTA